MCLTNFLNIFKCVTKLTSLCDMYYQYALISLITILRVGSLLKTYMFYLSVISLSILSETFDKDYILSFIIKEGTQEQFNFLQ